MFLSLLRTDKLSKVVTVIRPERDGPPTCRKLTNGIDPSRIATTLATRYRSGVLDRLQERTNTEFVWEFKRDFVNAFR